MRHRKKGFFSDRRRLIAVIVAGALLVAGLLVLILKLADQGKTMLIVTHEMQFARAVADRVIFLEDGVIKEEGSPDQFFDTPQTERAKEFLRTFTFERKHKM